MKRLTLFISIIFCVSSCLETSYIFPKTTHYYIDEIGVHVKRVTSLNKSEFTIERDSVVIDELVWVYSDKDEHGLITDSGTRNSLIFTSDSVYAEGQGWHYLKNDSSHPESPVVITRIDIPNAYWKSRIGDILTTNYYDSLCTMQRLRERESRSFELKMYPEIEFPDPWDTLGRVRRVNNQGEDFGYYVGEGHHINN